MVENGRYAKTRRKFKVTTDSKHPYPVAANLLNRDVTTTSLNQVWLADITYVWTWEGWLYLAVVMDLHSRRIVGWALESRMTADFACRVVQMAINIRGTREDLVHHSDRGSQYASEKYQKLLFDSGIGSSMSRKGNCWDKAPMESFFHSLQTEPVHHRIYPIRNLAKREITEYITMFYNTRRLHSSLDYTTPMDFETMPLARTA